ncbi:MAG: ABC transporter permease [Alistipes sp.]|nr:ABC transporter permease [Alistipes sp.]
MRRFFGDIWRVVAEEWRSVWHDEGVVLIVVFALFIYGISYSLGYGGEVLEEVPVAVVGGEGAIGRKFVRTLDASSKIEVAHEVADIGEAEQLLRDRKVWGVVAISPNLDGDILAGRQSRVAVLGDASYFLAYREVAEGAVAAIQQMNEAIVAQRNGVYNPPVIYEQRNLFNPSLGYGIFVMPAIILLIVQQTALIGVGMVSATRRERGIRLPSQSPLAVTLGRTLTYVAIYAVTLGFMLTVHYSLFDYPMRGEWWQCVAVVVPYLLAVILLAQGLGALFRRRESSIVWLLWLSIPFLLVSGVSLPPQAFPQWLYVVGRVVPSSAAVDAWIAIQSRGASLSDIAPQLTLLWILAILYGLLALRANKTSS